VTHSRGKGQAQPTPGSDVSFERSQWRCKREEGGKKGKRKSADKKGDNRAEEEQFDLEDEEEEEGVEGVGQGQRSAGKETFHSMAEIASCSYEARKVG
jgi:hypothetical protein